MTLVPTAAIQRNSQTTYVYLVKPDSTVTVRHDDRRARRKAMIPKSPPGLAPGEVVVMTGVDKLQEGSKVNAQIDGDKRQRKGNQAR